MADTTAELVTQLNTLLRLTSVEAATARARISQARTEATRKELSANAANCDKRADAIRTAISQLGGVADLVGLAIARAGFTARLPLEQTVPVTEALLADLALEHQLFDRARLVKVLAHDTKHASVVTLAERLEDAHGATIEWLFTVLGETAIGGPAALVATPAQSAAATARTTVSIAGATAVKSVNRAVSTAAQFADKAQETAAGTVSQRAARARQLGASALKVLTAGRNAALDQAETEATKDKSAGTAERVHSVRENLGAVSPAELPIPDYDKLSNKEAIDAIRALECSEDLRTVLAYERAHKNRRAMVTAAEKRTSELATELVIS